MLLLYNFHLLHWLNSPANRRHDSTHHYSLSIHSHTHICPALLSTDFAGLRVHRSLRLLSQTCEDYRAASTIDLTHDRSDLSSDHKLKIPAVRVLWGSKGMIEKMGGAVDVWEGFCERDVEVSGRSLDCGHYVPEEKDEELLEEILEFMK